MITKLYEKKYGCKPPESPASGSAPGAPNNNHLLNNNKGDESGDDYDDDFDDVPDLGQVKVKLGADEGADISQNLKSSKPLAANDDLEEEEAAA